MIGRLIVTFTKEIDIEEGTTKCKERKSQGTNRYLGVISSYTDGALTNEYISTVIRHGWYYSTSYSIEMQSQFGSDSKSASEPDQCC